mmetsp:Transcript_21507/g.69565  ORF Transcript_21507/g.69565 Transcript_21507/m.69565 type:complete len:216 (+) Transcript_21507:1424-2071(+)
MISGPHAESNLVELEGGLGDAGKVGVGVLEGTDGACEGDHEETQANQEESNFRDDATADQNEGRDFSGEDRQVGQQQEVHEHGSRGADRVREQHLFAILAMLVEEQPIIDPDAIQDRLQAQHCKQEDGQKQSGPPLPQAEVLGDLATAEVDDPLISHVSHRELHMITDRLAHAEHIDKAPATKNGHPDLQLGPAVVIAADAAAAALARQQPVTSG